MKRIAKRLTVAFAAGSLGGLACSVALWLMGAYGISWKLGIRISPPWSAQWLYPRLVWGGMWGLLFALPMLRGNIWKRGLLLSLAPTLVQLWVVLPHFQGQGVLGLALGRWTPLLVAVVNGIWGVTTALWMAYVKE